MYLPASIRNNWERPLCSQIFDLDTKGLQIPAVNLAELLNVDIAGWLAEVPLIKEHFARFGSHLPEGLNAEVKALEDRLQAAK